ncbi:hypothetical protein ACHAXS_010172 [Conticribra weissflogii]
MQSFLAMKCFSTATVLLVASVASIVSMTSAQKMGFGGAVMNVEDFEKFDAMSDMDRIMELTKNAWPECTKGRLSNAYRCEDKINRDLAEMNLSFPVETVILWTRHSRHPTAHALVIPIDDDGMCIGKHGDGRLFYEFHWCVDDLTPVTDKDAIDRSRKLLQPSTWSKMTCAGKQVQCDVDDNDLRDARDHVLDEMGGDFDIACSTQDGINKYRAAKAAGPVVKAGCNELPAFNCTGLSGVDTCKMIHEMVPYPNRAGKRMECFLQYRPGSPKHEEIQRELIGRGYPVKNKVIIYAKYSSKKVLSTPVMTGPNSSIGSE